MSLIRLLMGSAPKKVQAHSQGADSGADISTTATRLWDDGRTALLSCAMNTANSVPFEKISSAAGSGFRFAAVERAEKASRTLPPRLRPLRAAQKVVVASQSVFGEKNAIN